MSDLTASPSDADVLSGITLVRAQLAEQYPSASVLPGSAVDGLVVQPSGYMAAFHTATAQEALLRGSIAAMTAGLTTATDGDIDAQASNYFTERIPGAPASGLIKIVVQNATPYTIQPGFRVSFSDLTFSTTYEQRAYPAGTPGIAASTTNRLMTARSDGAYEFTVQVTAEQDGAASRLGRGTVLVLTNPSAGMLSSAVDTDFTGGTSEETNAELLARVSLGITTEVVAGEEQIQALIADTYPAARIATVGVGSALMTRDQANILGVSLGGRLDVYARAGQTIGLKTLTLNGTVTNSTTKAVTLTIPRPDADGIYRVTAIRPSGTVGLGGIVPTTTTRALSVLSSDPFTPTMPTQADLAFSAAVSVTVTFLDTLGTGTYVVSQVRSYDVDVSYQPNVRDFTDILTGVNRPPGTDILVKGAVPCLTQVQMTVRLPIGATSPTVGTMQSLVAGAINALDFGTSTLTSFVVHRALASTLTSGEVTAISFQGGILCPDGVDLVLTSAPSLTIPEQPAHKVGAANTCFTCGVNDVAITLTT